MKVYGAHMEQGLAQELFDTLAERCFSVTMTFTYHAGHVPAESYSVVVYPGLGAFEGVRLRELIEIADARNCDVTLIDNGLRLFPYIESRP